MEESHPFRQSQKSSIANAIVKQNPSRSGHGHGWLMKDPMVSFCGRIGRAAARPYRIGSGRDDLPVVRVSPEGFMSQPWVTAQQPPSLKLWRPGSLAPLDFYFLDKITRGTGA